MRAGLDIGNFMTSKNYLKALDKSGKTTDNFYHPPYYIGDALTHAVLAEKKLKGNRIAIGEELNSHLEIYNKIKKNEYLWRERYDLPYEVRWDKIDLAKEVHSKLLDRFSATYRNFYDIDSIKHNFINCTELLKSSDITDEGKQYYKKMIEIGKGWELLD